MSVAVWNCHSALGGLSAKACSSAKLCVLVFKASLLDSLGGPWAKVCLSAKCCVLVFKASMLYSCVCGGSLCQSVFIYQVLCTGIQGIYTLFVGGPSAKVCSSANCCVQLFKASNIYSWVIHWPKEICQYELWHPYDMLNLVNISCQSWNLLLSFGGVLGVLQGVRGCWGVLHLTWFYNGKWLLTTLII